MHHMSHLQDLSKTFTCLSKVTLPNIKKGLVKVTFQSPFQYPNGSLSKSLWSLKVYFRAVFSEWLISKSSTLVVVEVKDGEMCGADPMLNLIQNEGTTGYDIITQNTLN